MDFLEPVRAFLACPTPPRWVEAAIQDLPLLLQDHANCEKKAAGTAMNLLWDPLESTCRHASLSIL